MASPTKKGSRHWELRYKHLVDAARDPMIFVDWQGRILEWNPAAASLFGYSRRQALGSRLSDVIGMTAVASDESEKEVILKRKDGSELLCEVSVRVKGRGAGRIGTLLVRDITEARRTANLIRAQRQLALSLTEVETLAQGLRLCCETAVEVSEMDCGAVYLGDERSGRMNLEFCKGLSSDLAEGLFDDDDSPRTRSAMAGSPFYAGRAEMETPPDPGRGEGIRCLGIVPIWGENRHIGSLCVASRQMDQMPPFSRMAIERLAALTGGALARLKAKRALRDSQERLQLALAAGVTVFDWDVRTGEVVWRPAPDGQSMPLERGSEHTCEALERRIHPEDATRLKAFFADWFASGHGKEEFEYRLFHRNGEMRWKLSSARLIRSPEGEARRVIGTTVDITGRKRTENLLSAERNLARGLSRANTIEGALRLCTEAAIEASEMECGWAYLVDWAAGTLSLVFHKGLPPGLAEKLAHPGAALLNRRLVGVGPLFLRREELDPSLYGSPGTGEIRSVAAASIWSENRVVACLNVASLRCDEVPSFGRIAVERIAGQTGTYILGLNAEAALRESEEKYRRLFEDSRDAIFLASPDGKVRECNEAFCSLLGYTRDEAALLRIGEISLKPRHRLSLLEEIDRMGSVKDFELRLKRKDGSEADCLVTAARKYSPKGAVTGYEGIIRDVTERRRLELEILRISEFERQEIGQDLHDNIGQLLTGVALKAKSLARKSLAEAEEAGGLADLVNEAIGQVRDLAKGLVLVDIDAGGVCAAIRELVARMRDIRGVSCEAFFSPATIELGELTGTQLYRIAQEAVVNAYRHSEAKRIEIHLRQVRGVTTLRVQDDGMGIGYPWEGKRGLGLHLMKYRAELINGSLEVKNGPKNGTIVTCVVAESESASRASEDGTKSTAEANDENDKNTDRR
jgi:PAS domain S-box-containing protein